MHHLQGGCLKEPICPSYAPYLCNYGDYSFKPPRCVAKGFDFGCCADKTDGSGLCLECAGGCYSREEAEKTGLLRLLDGSCGTGKYICINSHISNAGEKPGYKCVQAGYDLGCCGGVKYSERITSIKATLSVKSGKCTSPVKFEVKDGSSGEYLDYTDKCLQGYRGESGGSYYEISLKRGESATIYCTFKGTAGTAAGQRIFRVTWCGKTQEFVYQPVENGGTGNSIGRITVVAHGEIFKGSKVSDQSPAPQEGVQPTTNTGDRVFIVAHGEPLTKSAKTPNNA